MEGAQAKEELPGSNRKSEKCSGHGTQTLFKTKIKL
jgi:hypothetical protein